MNRCSRCPIGAWLSLKVVPKIFIQKPWNRISIEAMSNFKFVIGGGWTWSLSYIWSLLPFIVIVYLWDCLNVFLVSLRSSCLFVCLSAGVYVACGLSWPVCLNVSLCPLDQVCLFVSIRSIWLDLSWGTTKQRCRGESCHHLIFRVQLGRLFCRRLNTGAFHQSTGHLFNGFPPSFTMLVKCFQLL